MTGLNIDAFDCDVSEDYSRVRYSLEIEDFYPFDINPITGRLTVNLDNDELDYETKPEITFNIQATDTLSKKRRHEPNFRLDPSRNYFLQLNKSITRTFTLILI